MHEYKVNILKLVDGDTVDVDIDLGFGIWLRKERVRIMGIDTPESRTSDKVEKVFGLAAKNRLSSLLGAEAILQTQVSKKGEDMKGKFGRVLGNFISLNGEKCAAVLVREGHAVAYSGGSKEDVASQHLANRERLVREGKVVVPEGMSIAPIKNPPPPVENDPPNVKTATPKKTTAKKTTKKTTAKKK
jgi:micrococcal nuclease|tara:strand:- start:53 stop:616 length:564 start_codon:yes stop_codon:yes gene_type:complete